MSENNNYNDNKKAYEFTISSQVLIYYHFGDSREARPTLSYNTPHTHKQTNRLLYSYLHKLNPGKCC